MFSKSYFPISTFSQILIEHLCSGQIDKLTAKKKKLTWQGPEKISLVFTSLECRHEQNNYYIQFIEPVRVDQNILEKFIL